MCVDQGFRSIIPKNVLFWGKIGKFFCGNDDLVISKFNYCPILFKIYIFEQPKRITNANPIDRRIPTVAHTN